MRRLDATRFVSAAAILALAVFVLVPASPAVASSLDRLAEALDTLAVEPIGLPTLSAEPDDLLVTVPIEGIERDLQLSRHSMRADRFELLVTDANGVPVAWPAPRERTYRGHIVGDPDSTVAASVTVDGGLVATLVLEGVEYAVQPMPTAFASLFAANHVVLRTRDAIDPGMSCGVTEDFPTAEIEANESEGTYGGLSLYQCQIACDADREYYAQNGSDVGATMADIEQVLNAVELIYERDVEIVYEITTILVRTSEPDPYSTTDPGDLLVQFRNHWRNNQGGIQRDVAHLFTGKNLAGSVIGIAYLGRICSTWNGYGLSQARYTGNFLLRTSLVAHELGHNWDSSHCTGTDCRIMCSSNGGCTGDVTRFGQSSINQIIGHRNSRGCLDLVDLPDALSPSIVETFPNTTIDSALWGTVSGATVDNAASNERSEPFALKLSRSGANDHFVETNRIEFNNATTTPFFSYWVQGRGLEGNESLAVEYFDRDLTWKLLERVNANQTNPDFFQLRTRLVTGPEYHDRLQLRFRSEVDDSGESFYIDNVNLVETEVLIDIQPLESAVNPGDFFDFNASVTNLTSQTQSVSAWIDVFRPDGSPLYASNPRVGPKSFNLSPGASINRTGLSLRVPESTPPALGYRVVLFVGQFPDEIQYADTGYFQVAE